jgi:death-on-curing protein
MEIPIDEDWLKTLYDILIRIYSDTDRPIVSGFPIVTDYDEGMLSVCVERGKTTILGKSVYPHPLQRAAVLMHSIINFHPFVDGNKRAALLATNFYLHWNGYKLMIPSNADDFTIDVAKGKFGLNDVLIWLRRNTIRTPFTVLRHWFCEIEILEHPQISTAKRLENLPRAFFFPRDALLFFRAKVMEDRIKKVRQARNGK